MFLHEPVGSTLASGCLGEWLVIVRLENFIPAQLDELMRQRLLNECFATWLSEQLQQLKAGGGKGERGERDKPHAQKLLS